MIKFTELRVHKGHLLITAEVRDLEYYDNIYISQIKIDSQDTFDTHGPSSNLIYESEIFESGTKKVTLVLDSSSFNGDIDINKTMFFVYAVAGGTPTPNTPCGLDPCVSVGVTFALCPIYNETMQYVKQIENTCEIPQPFVNLILQYKAIQYSINSGHFTQAIKYYNKFYKNLGVSTTKTCGCNG